MPQKLTERGFEVIINCMSGNMRHASAPGERLGAVLDMLGTAETVWDVGCDHGRLACALLKNGAAEHVIATDISPASAAKAQQIGRAHV